MYRVINQMKTGGFEILTRSKHSNGWDLEPVWTQDAADARIITYATSWGALKRMAQLRRQRYDVLVIDAAEGVEIPESERLREEIRV